MTIEAAIDIAKIVDKMPDGWKVLDEALTAPLCYKWIHNGESRFKKVDGKYIVNPARKIMLCKIESEG